MLVSVSADPLVHDFPGPRRTRCVVCGYPQLASESECIGCIRMRRGRRIVLGLALLVLGLGAAAWLVL